MDLLGIPNAEPIFKVQLSDAQLLCEKLPNGSIQLHTRMETTGDDLEEELSFPLSEQELISCQEALSQRYSGSLQEFLELSGILNKFPSDPTLEAAFDL